MNRIFWNGLIYGGALATAFALAGINQAVALTLTL